MAQIEIRVSDLTGEQIRDDRRAARLIVEHPDFPEPIRLDVLPDEVAPHLTDEATRFVVLSLEDPDNPNPQRYVMAFEEFNSLFQTGNADAALADAELEQADEPPQRARRDEVVALTAIPVGLSQEILQQLQDKFGRGIKVGVAPPGGSH